MCGKRVMTQHLVLLCLQKDMAVQVYTVYQLSSVKQIITFSLKLMQIGPNNSHGSTFTLGQSSIPNLSNVHNKSHIALLWHQRVGQCLESEIENTSKTAKLCPPFTPF